MKLLAHKAETPLRAATRIFGAVVIALALLLGTLTAIRPTTFEGPRVALSDHHPVLLSHDNDGHCCRNQQASGSPFT
jgi:hypothetical protein